MEHLELKNLDKSWVTRVCMIDNFDILLMCTDIDIDSSICMDEFIEFAIQMPFGMTISGYKKCFYDKNCIDTGDVLAKLGYAGEPLSISEWREMSYIFIHTSPPFFHAITNLWRKIIAYTNQINLLEANPK